MTRSPNGPSNRYTLAHITHEAVEQVGGIGTVLEGLMVSPVYQRHVGRSILVGPIATHIHCDPAHRLGKHGRVRYSSVDKIDEVGLSAKFRPIESAFNVAIVYGTRRYELAAENRSGDCEVLLIDVFQANLDRLNTFKWHLWERFGLQSLRYEESWDFEEYVRLAEPAINALRALLDDANLPCVLFAHEYMGLPAALAAILAGSDIFRTVFHGHECATARRIVENHPGHDTMFYNVLGQAQTNNLYVTDVFGNRDACLRHALISRCHLCDGIIAVGDHTRDELQFLNAACSNKKIDIVYNGLPAMQVNAEQKLQSRQALVRFAAHLVDFEPDVLMTHVTRPVISKGLWRDVAVCHELDSRFAAQGRRGVLFILTSAGGIRRTTDVRQMEQEYGWPRHHREGFPDLVGPEIDLHRIIESFNSDHRHIQIILVNQFGWSPDRISDRLPALTSMADLRRGTDVEFGMATYEPFGISPLEPLGCGAICVVSSVCGCERFVGRISNGSANVICADFTCLSDPHSINDLLAITAKLRYDIVHSQAAQTADRLMDLLPLDDQGRLHLLRSGQRLVAQMGWDQVIEDGILPLLERVCNHHGQSSDPGCHNIPTAPDGIR